MKKNDNALFGMFCVIAGLIFFICVDKQKNLEHTTELQRTIDIQNLAIDNLEYQFNQCRTLYIGQ